MPQDFHGEREGFRRVLTKYITVFLKSLGDCSSQHDVNHCLRIFDERKKKTPLLSGVFALLSHWELLVETLLSFLTLGKAVFPSWLWVVSQSWVVLWEWPRRKGFRVRMPSRRALARWTWMEGEGDALHLVCRGSPPFRGPGWEPLRNPSGRGQGEEQRVIMLTMYCYTTSNGKAM